jgi:hypothetical protein
MGLDMFLNRKIYIGANYNHNGVKGTIDITKGDRKVDIEMNRVVYIVEQIGYWRKANMIHKWFVDNVQGGTDDCRSYWVDREKLQELLILVNKVLRKHALAEELLPCGQGFFFGGNAYDQYYFEDLKETKKILELALSFEDGSSIEYDSSW